jgi:heat shock protein HslJ
LTIASAVGVLVFEKPEPVADRPLTGTVWALETINSGETAQSVLAGTQVTLEFTKEQVSGSTGCNFYGAGYTLDGDAFVVGMMEVTEKYCSDELMTQEGTYLAALGAAESLTLEGDRLVIGYPDGELVFRPATDLPL